MRYTSKAAAAKHRALIGLREGYLILQIFLMMFPLVYLILCSMKSYEAIIQSPFSLPTGFSDMIANFKMAFSGNIEIAGGYLIPMYTPFFEMLTNTLYLVAIALIFMVVAATPMGYVMGARKFKGKEAVMLYVLFIQTVPLFGYLTSFFVLMDKISFTNNLTATGIIYAGVSIPGVILFMKGFYSSFPVEVEEAAMLDGANELQRFVLIVLPMSKGIIIALVLTQFMGYWNEFALVNLLVSEPELRTISINVMMTSSSIYQTYTFALLVLSALPTLFFFTVFQKRITQGGIAVGSVKG